MWKAVLVLCVLATSLQANMIQTVPSDLWATPYGKVGTGLLCLSSATGVIASSYFLINSSFYIYANYAIAN